MENRLKDMLRRDKIRLWLPPYANEDFTSRQIPEVSEQKSFNCDKTF